jgi:arylsulfatase A-like enzyme
MSLHPRLQVVLVGLALLWSAGCGADLPERKPARAVIVVDIDTLRADHLGSYGYSRPTSPNLDRFAGRAVQFDWAFSQAPNTLPSQTSILTSLYPSTHLVLHDDDRLAPERDTLAELLAAAGFSTGAFVDGGYLKPHFGLDQGFETYFDLNGGGLAEGEARIASWLDAHRSEKFFLFLHTYDVHSPYAPPAPFRERFAALVAPPTPGFEPTSEALEGIRISQYSAAPLQLPARDLAYAEALYDGEIAYVDAWFGRLLARLENLGIADSTIVAVISDHGEEFAEHGSVLHEKLYTTVTHVPLLLQAPGGDRGSRISHSVETIDLAPTLLELAGVPVPPAMDGRSLAAHVAGRGAGAPPPGRPAIVESPFFGVQRGLLDDRHHLLLSLQSGRIELFRYREDREERRDLAGEEPDEVRRLVGELRRWSRGRPAERMLELEKVALPPEVQESLRSLGYLR